MARLSEDPARAAVFLDVDGTLAPIVSRPELARGPGRDPGGAAAPRPCDTRSSPASAGGPVRTPGASWGSTGFSTLACTGLELAPEADAWRAPLREVRRARVAVGRGHRASPWRSHWRRGRRRGCCARLARGGGRTCAQALGLEAHWGRKVLEVRPPVGTQNKEHGRAVAAGGARAAEERSTPATTRPTSTPSRGLDGLEVAVRVAVTSAESTAGAARERRPRRSTPPAELLRTAPPRLWGSK